MRAKGPRYKKGSVVGVKIVSTMSVDRKRKTTHPPEGKKKKKTIQTMTPVDCDPVVGEVVEDTRAAVEEMMKEMNDMAEQSTPQFTLMTVFDNEVGHHQIKDNKEKVNYMVCPCHDVRLEARESQKGWKYVKCPIQPCLLFCGQDQALEYMKAVYSQPHTEVLDMWTCLQCFCREPATLQQSHSTQNPDRLFLNCSKKTCAFFRWADQPLGPKYWSWFHDNPPKKADQQAEIPTRDAQGYPKRGVDIPGPPPRAPRKEDRPLTDYEKQLLREIQELKNRQEMMVAPAPPPPKYSDSVENWQKSLETVVYDGLF